MSYLGVVTYLLYKARFFTRVVNNGIFLLSDMKFCWSKTELLLFLKTWS